MHVGQQSPVDERVQYTDTHQNGRISFLWRVNLQMFFFTGSGDYFLYSCVLIVGEDKSQVLRHAVMVEAFRALGALHEPKHILKQLQRLRAP